MGGPISGMSWQNVNENMFNAEKEALKFGEIAEKRTQEWEAGRSHGAARFFKCVFSLGINEIWRAVSKSNYFSDMEKMAGSLQNFHAALAPELEDVQQNIGGEVKLATQKYKEVTRNDVEVAGEKVKVTRFAAGGGEVIVRENGLDIRHNIDDCDKLRSQIEMEVMRNAKFFKPEFVKSLISAQKDVIDHANNPDGRTDDLATRSVDGESRESMVAKAGLAHFKRDKGDLNYESGVEETMLPKEAAKMRLRNMLSAFYESTLGLPKEVGRTLDLEIGTSFVDKVLKGEITSPDKLRAFIDKGNKSSHVTDAESQKLFAEFEKATASNATEVKKIEIGKDYRTGLESKAGMFEPKGEAKEVHDFVADLILNEDVYDYDKDMVQGEKTGARLSRLVEKNKALVAKMMNPVNRETMLATLDPAMRAALDLNFLTRLEKDYQEYLKDPKKAGDSREVYLGNKLEGMRSDEAKRRTMFGTRDISSFTDAELDTFSVNKQVQKDPALGSIIEKNVYLSDDPARKELQKSVDFFSTIEADIDKAVTDACRKLQRDISARIESVFKKSEAKGNLSVEELGSKSLAEIKKSYEKEQTLELVRNTLNVYFKEMPLLSQRQMIASETRHSMYRDPDGYASSDGAKLGAVLKGAGPVMQKMLQGINPEMITDPDMKLALADMKDNLEPISEKAINAYLFDIIKTNNSDPNATRIEKITVEKSLGQASVGQALLCSLKREGQEPEKVVIKLLRPNANLSARREHDIFMNVAKEMGDGMEATFKGRYKSIKDELDLSQEAANAETAGKVYNYNDKDPYHGQPFTNVTSAGLAEGFKPAHSTMVQKCAQGSTLKKVLNEEAGDLQGRNIAELKGIKAKLEKTHAALTNLSYMWAQEGLFGAGFYHGDLHEGNIIIDKEGKATVIDFGNATQLDANGRTNVIRVIAGMAVSDASIFFKGFENLLESKASQDAFKANRPAIEAKMKALLGPSHKGINDTALRLDIALKVMQMDFKIEVPSAVHNFLESQRRLNDAMMNTEAKLKAIDEALAAKGEEVKTEKRPTMIKCLIDVVKHNVGIKLLKTIGVSGAKQALEAIKSEKEPSEKPAVNDGQVVIYP